jgi:Fic family protein
VPEHISAAPAALQDLLAGVIEYARRALAGGGPPIVAAAAVAFGFVDIHPSVDGNGRIHRWLIHHVLAAAGYNPPGIVFPISSAIPRRIAEYRAVLQSYSVELPRFLEAFDTFSAAVKEMLDMPDRQVEQLRRFLEQGGGQLSERDRTKEFASLTDEEVARVQASFANSFGLPPNASLAPTNR